MKKSSQTSSLPHYYRYSNVAKKMFEDRMVCLPNVFTSTNRPVVTEGLSNSLLRRPDIRYHFFYDTATKFTCIYRRFITCNKKNAHRHRHAFTYSKCKHTCDCPRAFPPDNRIDSQWSLNRYIE